MAAMQSHPKFARAFAAMIAHRVTALRTRIVRCTPLTGSRARSTAAFHEMSVRLRGGPIANATPRK